MATLKDKTLFITGASRGIGKAIAIRAARDGANVVVVGKGVAIARALLRAGWQETAAGSVETVAAKSHHYRGRPPDATFHQYRSDGSERKALRLWLSPMSVDGESVWLAQASNDTRRIKDNRGFVSYRVDPDLDAESFAPGRVYTTMADADLE